MKAAPADSRDGFQNASQKLLSFERDLPEIAIPTSNPIHHFSFLLNKSLHKKDRCGNISLPASVSFYPMLFSTHEFPMEVHPDHGKMSFSFRYNHPSGPAQFQFLSHSILLLYHLHSPL